MMRPYNDPDDEDNQFQWWLGELGHYLLEKYNFDLMTLLMKNRDIAAKSAELMKEEFMKGTDSHTFGDSIIPLTPHMKDFMREQREQRDV